MGIIVGVEPKKKRRRAKLVALVMLGAVAFAVFVGLGNWQRERLVWKRDLIERVTSRVEAPAVPAPVVSEWPVVSRDTHEYRHIWMEGRFLSGRDTRVVAATELGSGYWIMTPFDAGEHGIVLINRGFVAQGVVPAAAPEQRVRVDGLLRMSEPKGSVLRKNQPEQARWYSRDVAAIGVENALQLAPYFVDAAAAQLGSPGGQGPVGGLTVIHFHNSHLVYLITWYALAIMVLGAGYLVWREERRPA